MFLWPCTGAPPEGPLSGGGFLEGVRGQTLHLPNLPHARDHGKILTPLCFNITSKPPTPHTLI